MFEQQKVLNKIEQLVDKLPWKTVRIEIEMSNQTLVLSKERKQQIGFQYEDNTKVD